ncbi:MAG: Octaprenyl diphosphate synthase (EC / Dimethylallyltransferase (EC / (2E,6E)-farnesyl diphosphate synthase (EC / Geranylgeranyl pyrophosphate synthetase (EC [uncultured Sulfurovum sp.]|uniref:Octaprenyl diphosphate synthase -farnesyl diphosphate synthase ))) n=1 Tax=uncultured Sulfurovum sp. TaxID=269237 RepID=A0A6S6TY16_9BACT|nr:MAG: Octaprenyl diphosphate synthase (EC / Dimethylallyltransferase (EC / (2E,6E)-farnesyl diphosphate synthase (EC / Geranylgeranyl pyrophosphate synthetase (EC [uncultured Sulfurovum sp.]
MQKFEAYLKANLPTVETFHPHYNDALASMLLAGGKRFRPMLLLSVVEAYEPLLYEGALAPALALEFLHTYSLIHDDLPAMDDAPLRRGFETLHVTYDDATAILIGDALNTEAFYHISKAALRDDVKVKLVELLARDGGTYGMVLGQSIDIHFENTPLTLEQVKILHTNKTAKLIATSLLMGAVIVGLEKSKQEALYAFGIDLGLLFQIQDDIIDETHTEEEAGKTTGNDDEKNSFINLIGLEKTIEEAEELAKHLEEEFAKFDDVLQDGLKASVIKYLYRHR